MNTIHQNHGFVNDFSEKPSPQHTPAQPPHVDAQRLAQMMTDALRILRDDQSLSVKPTTGSAEVGE